MARTEHGIVVGVTGRTENLGALRWAADEARRRRCPVTLVHVVSSVLPTAPPEALLVPTPLDGLGRATLDEAAADLVRYLGRSQERPRTVLQVGHPARVLVDLSHDAELVVTGHRPRHGRARVRLASTATSLGAHAGCPTVAVPEGWAPPAEDAEPGWVTVGMHDAGTPEAVLDAAFAAAASRGARLRLVHAWRADTAYDDIIVRRTDPDWALDLTARMLADTEPWAARHPDVKVEALALHQWPADALDDLAASSDLLVLGRHTGVLPLPHRIGSLARHALTSFACPVMVVPVETRRA